ncbi:hypothetical protein J6590_055261 [Homalodisca vitripennis]|nr:hypothetical protein J6590_055261 [Homalodisca vitripennis]
MRARVGRTGERFSRLGLGQCVALNQSTLEPNLPVTSSMVITSGGREELGPLFINFSRPRAKLPPKVKAASRVHRRTESIVNVKHIGIVKLNHGHLTSSIS